MNAKQQTNIHKHIYLEYVCMCFKTFIDLSPVGEAHIYLKKFLNIFPADCFGLAVSAGAEPALFVFEI